MGKHIIRAKDHYIKTHYVFLCKDGTRTRAPSGRSLYYWGNNQLYAAQFDTPEKAMSTFKRLKPLPYGDKITDLEVVLFQAGLQIVKITENRDH